MDNSGIVWTSYSALTQTKRARTALGYAIWDCISLWVPLYFWKNWSDSFFLMSSIGNLCLLFSSLFSLCLSISLILTNISFCSISLYFLFHWFFTFALYYFNFDDLLWIQFSPFLQVSCGRNWGRWLENFQVFEYKHLILQWYFSSIPQISRLFFFSQFKMLSNFPWVSSFDL